MQRSVPEEPRRPVLRNLRSWPSLTRNSSSDDADSDAQCPNCGLTFREEDSESIWIYCDWCQAWFDFICSGLTDSEHLPAVYFAVDVSVPHSRRTQHELIPHPIVANAWLPSDLSPHLITFRITHWPPNWTSRAWKQLFTATLKTELPNQQKDPIDVSSSATLPLTQDKLVAFVAVLAQQGLKHQSIKCYLSALRYYQITVNISDPFQVTKIMF